jgi:undecaprenyl-diphosphatase
MNFLLQLDHRLFFLINGMGRESLDSVFLEISALGAWPIALVTLAVLGERGWRALCRHALALAVGVAVVSAANSALKDRIDRARPPRAFAQEVAAGTATIRIVEPWTLRGNSFPSGHSVTAFAFMTYLGFYKRSYRAWALLLAGLIAFSRVYVGLHFPSDCVAGALLGAAGAWLAWQVHRRTEGNREPEGLKA